MHPTHLQSTRSAWSSTARRAALVLATATFLPLVATSCGGGDPLGPDATPGTARVTATGAVSASGSGLAVFQSVSSAGMSLFQIAVAPATQASTTWQLQIVSYAGRPAVGTYQLTALGDGDLTASFYHTSGGTMEMFNATSGELVITNSSTSGVRGTFTFMATNAAGTSTVSVQGSFNAQCAPGTSCL